MKNYLNTTLLVGAFLTQACSGAQEHVFVERLGTDTLMMEMYTHTDQYIEGVVITRSPLTRLAHYRAELGEHGIQNLAVSWETPASNPSGPPEESSLVTFEGDSITMVKTGGRNPGTITLAADGVVIPRVGAGPFSFGMFEHLASRAGGSGEDQYAYSTVRAGSPRVQSNAVVKRDDNTVAFDYFGSPLVMTVADGHATGWCGMETTMKVEAELTDAVDFDALASDFAARDAAGEGIGTPSPGATVQASVAGANFEIVYSQPAKRGREIWGGLVPDGEVWRTGANGATHFTTDRDLAIAGASVPAGTYTLWSTFEAGQGTLIINSQTRQWGTQYDSAQDLVRIPLDMESVGEVVERFTMGVDDSGGNTRLTLTWDQTRYSVAMEVR
jgi:hypothetical protein